MEKLNIQKQLDSFANKRLPYWEDFPDFELYMDQLVNLGNRYRSEEHTSELQSQR